MEIERLSISGLLFMFIFYLISHFLIGLALNKTEKFNKQKPGNVEYEKYEKWLKILFKWYPVIYVAFIILFGL